MRMRTHLPGAGLRWEIFAALCLKLLLLLALWFLFFRNDGASRLPAPSVADVWFTPHGATQSGKASVLTPRPEEASHVRR